MDRRGSLRSARVLIDLAAVRMARLADGVEHRDVREAQMRLAEARAVIDHVFLNGTWWRRPVVEAGAVGLAVWASAVVAGRVLQLGAGLTIGLALVVAGVVQLVAERLSASVVRAARHRRRGTRDGQGPWVPPDTSAEAELLGLLKLARTALVEAVVARPRRSRLAGLVLAVMTYLWLHGSGRRRYWISTAERRLCQSIAATHRWLAAVREAE